METEKPEPIPVAISNAGVQRPGCLRWFVREGRLRSGWRVTLYVIVSRILTLLAQLPLAIVIALVIGLPLAQAGVPTSEIQARLAGLFSNIFEHPALALAFEAENVVAVLTVVWIFRRFVDRRSFVSLGFRLVPRWWLQVLAGIGFSIAGWAVIFFLSLAFGAATVTGFEWSTDGALAVLGGLAFGLVLNLFVGIAEEADARGYVLQNLAEGIHLWPAIIVSSLYFGLLHLLNPGAGLTSTLGIFFAGILLALGYVATGQLWFSIGMHAGWNFAEGPLFGFLVSGLNMGGLFHLRVIGPDWLMGGAFGPEAGALAVAIELLMIAVLFVWNWRRKPAIPTGIGEQQVQG